LIEQEANRNIAVIDLTEKKPKPKIIKLYKIIPGLKLIAASHANKLESWNT